MFNPQRAAARRPRGRSSCARPCHREVRRDLEGHVDPVEDHGPAAPVDELAVLHAKRLGRLRGNGRREERDEDNEGGPSVHARELTLRTHVHAREDPRAVRHREIGLALCDPDHIQAGGTRIRDGQLLRAGLVGAAPIRASGRRSPSSPARRRSPAREGEAGSGRLLLAGTLWFRRRLAASRLFDGDRGRARRRPRRDRALRSRSRGSPPPSIAFSLLLAAAGTGAEAILLSAAGTLRLREAGSARRPDLAPGPLPARRAARARAGGRAQ